MPAMITRLKMLDEAFQNSAENAKETPHSIVYRRDCECWWWWLVLRGEHLHVLARDRVKVRDVPLYSIMYFINGKSANHYHAQTTIHT